MVRNIFISGADGTRKTSTVKKLADFIGNDLGRRVKWLSFPTDHTFANIGIAAYEQERTKVPPKALTMAYALDRLEEAEWSLLPYREKFPDVIYIFDRGPLDGKVYALDRFRDQLTPRVLNWINGLDSMFEEIFPVDLGFLMTAPSDASEEMIKKRFDKDMDVFDKDVGWQERTRPIFDKLVQNDPLWNRVELRPDGSEFETIKEITRIKIKFGNIESEISKHPGTER